MDIRRGYTLLELLIVVAILALVTALAWPAFRSPWGRSRIEEAGHMVRVAMARARVEAIESATPYQFRFCPSSGIYEYGPAVLGQSEDDASLDAGGSRDSLDSDSAAGEFDSGDSEEWEPEDLTVQGELPEGVRFVDPLFEESEITGSVRLDTASVEPSGLDDTFGDADWSTPIIFYPNGRSMSARIRLTSVDRRGIDVVLRGLTGTAKVGKPFVTKSTDEEEAGPADEDVNEPIDPPNPDSRPEPERSEQGDA